MEEAPSHLWWSESCQRSTSSSNAISMGIIKTNSGSWCVLSATHMNTKTFDFALFRFGLSLKCRCSLNLFGGHGSKCYMPRERSLLKLSQCWGWAKTRNHADFHDRRHYPSAKDVALILAAYKLKQGWAREGCFTTLYMYVLRAVLAPI